MWQRIVLTNQVVQPLLPHGANLQPFRFVVDGPQRSFHLHRNLGAAESLLGEGFQLCDLLLRPGLCSAFGW